MFTVNDLYAISLIVLVIFGSVILATFLSSRSKRALQKKQHLDLTVQRICDDMIKKEREALLVKGENIGYEKGFRAGQDEARHTFKQDFVNFLQAQITVLTENQTLPPPENEKLYVIE